MKNILLIIVFFIGGMILALKDKISYVSTHTTTNISEPKQKTVQHKTEKTYPKNTNKEWWIYAADSLGSMYSGDELYVQILKYVSRNISYDYTFSRISNKSESSFNKTNNYKTTKIKNSTKWMVKHKGVCQEYAITVAEMMRVNGYECGIVSVPNHVFNIYINSNGDTLYGTGQSGLYSNDITEHTKETEIYILKYDAALGEYTCKI
jgi:hypothetical protein